MTPEPLTPRLLAWSAAAIVILGSLFFLMGGRAHPSIGSGATPEEFFLAFAAKVRHTHGWHGMHMLILIGPLCWAVAAPAVLDVLRPGLRALTSAARSALLLSGALWGVAFVLDGFGAPVYAEAMTGEAAGDVMTSFKANAVMMSRLGLVSWVAGGVGMAILGASLLTLRSAWRAVVGVAGLLIGLWPLLAAVQGEYAGGPFTSRFWLWNAVAAALWYIALASCVFGARKHEPG